MIKQFSSQLNYIPNRIREARVARAMTQAELATEINVTKSAISQYETGTIKPADMVMRSISNVLTFPLPFFLKEPYAPSTAPSAAFFRSYKSTSEKQRQACIQRTELFDELIIGKLKEFVEFPAVNTVDDISYQDAYTLDDCEAYAEHVRKFWGLGDGPIDSMVDVLQENGIIIAQVAPDMEKIDACSRWYNGTPYIFISYNKESSVRWRFSLAHELGHLLLHAHMEDIPPSMRDQVEEEANFFASAFLLPQNTFFRDISAASLEHLLYLKRKWKVSVGAMVKKCKDHEVFSSNQSTSLYRQISYRGWRKAEPFDDISSKEHPYLLKQALNLIIKNDIVAPDSIESEFGISPQELASWCHAPLELVAPIKKKTSKPLQLKRIDKN